jgi:phosphopantothenoylcysteine decarboxylase/phosphopantothenate--cysteine ligase
MADNLLTAVYLAFRGPVVLAPSMNWAMNEHAATRRNVATLVDRGCLVVEGESGELACGEEGSGRMAEPEVILAAVRRAFAGLARGPLAGHQVVVTAGGTREAVDAVRFLGNRSSGKMGRAVADACYLHGAHVTLVSAVEQDAVPYDVIAVESAAQMAAAVKQLSGGADVLVMAAAVADYRPADPVAGKIERAGAERMTLELQRTEDVLAGAARPGLLRVAFAAEAGPQLERARRKRAEKGVELLVFNDILAAGIGIGAEDNEITIIGPDGDEHVPRAPKSVCAEAIVAAVERELLRRT